MVADRSAGLDGHVDILVLHGGGVGQRAELHRQQVERRHSALDRDRTHLSTRAGTRGEASQHRVAVHLVASRQSAHGGRDLGLREVHFQQGVGRNGGA